VVIHTKKTRVTCAECSEVFTSFRTDIVKQFNDNTTGYKRQHDTFRMKLVVKKVNDMLQLPHIPGLVAIKKF